MTGEAVTASFREIHASLGAEFQEVHALIEGAVSGHEGAAGEALARMLPMRGKMLRPMLVFLCGRACGGAGPDHVTLAAVVEMIHQGALIHDDVLDAAEVRHGAPSANTAMGNAAAVMLGDLLVAHAFGLCASLSVPRFCRLAARTVAELCEGEVAQIAHRGRWEITPREYLLVADRKTASLTALCCRLGAEAAGADAPAAAALEQYGRKIGTAFQIVDDVLDLTGQADALGKSLGQDLAGGDLTLPVIHYLGGDRRRIEQVRAAAEGTGRAALTEALARAGSIDYARATARRYLQEALAALAGAPAHPARDELSAVAEFVLARRR